MEKSVKIVTEALQEKKFDTPEFLEALTRTLDALMYLSGSLFVIGKSFSQFADVVLSTGIYTSQNSDESNSEE